MAFYSQDPLVLITDAVLDENEMLVPVSPTNSKLSKFVHNGDNSTVELDGVRYSELKGFKKLSYHRISLPTFFKNIKIRIRAPEVRTSVELLPYILHQYGLDLKASDIVSKPVKYLDPEDDAIYECTLEIVANHPIYYGSVEVSVVGITFDLSEMVKVLAITGLVDNGPKVQGRYNNSYITYGIDYSEGATALQSIPNISKDPRMLTDDEAKTLVRTLPGIDGLPWVFSTALLPFNVNAGVLAWNGTVEAYYEKYPTPANLMPNREYTHVMIVRGTVSRDANTPSSLGYTNGSYVFHYDVIAREE